MAGIPRQSALLVVDVQNDFCPGGALAVFEGDQVVPALNATLRLFAAVGAPILVSRDWHPAQTTHFVSGGGPWPPHCIQGTPGAAFHPDLALPAGALVVSKGMGSDEDAYSAFQARDDVGRCPGDILQQLDIRHLYIGGLTLDYCVRFSALDARTAGLDTTVLLDATRAVNVRPHDGELAIVALLRAGVRLATSEQLGAKTNGKILYELDEWNE